MCSARTTALKQGPVNCTGQLKVSPKHRTTQGVTEPRKGAFFRPFGLPPPSHDLSTACAGLGIAVGMGYQQNPAGMNILA